MSKSERFENMQGRILPNFDESTSRILVDDELIAAFLYINSYGSMHERFPFEVTPAAAIKHLLIFSLDISDDSFGRIEKLGVPVVKSAAANERDVASVLAGNHSVQSVAHYRDGKVQI